MAPVIVLNLKFIFMKSISGFMPSDISGTIELDLAKEHNLIIQSMASSTGQDLLTPLFMGPS